MRSPSTFTQAYGWWLDVISGKAHRLDGWHIDDPHCGFYRRRFVKGGPWVPVEVKMVREIDPETNELTAPEKLVAVCEGRITDPRPIWLSLEPISRDEYEQLVEMISRDDRMAASMVALDLSETPTRPPKGTRR